MMESGIIYVIEDKVESIESVILEHFHFPLYMEPKFPFHF